MNSATMMASAIFVFALGFKFYSKFLASKVAKLDDGKTTPAIRLNDGKDYMPTNKWVVFFYHYATIAGSGVLLGPTLAAQYGWLPCILWILTATCLAGGVHDFMVMFLSIRHDGKSIGQIAKMEVGKISWIAVTLATYFMVIVAIAGMGTGLIAALMHNVWATFSVATTIPISLFIYAYARWIRKGRFVEGAIIGLFQLILLLLIAPKLNEMGLLRTFDLGKEQLILLIALYASVASIVPVHVLLGPRDHLSGLIKVSVIALLVVTIFAAHPELKMPPITEYAVLGGPVIPGALWPFLFIIITCGAISGWHSLSCSGVSPRLVSRETDIRTVAYGAWLTESAIAVVALCLACILFPSDYFAINATPNVYATLEMVPVELPRLSELVGMNLQGRVGGVTSLGISAAKLLSSLFGGDTALAIWYQFSIVYIALFTMPIMDHGTRMARYFVQDAMGITYAKQRKWWPSTIFLTIFMAFLWAYLLYTGTIGVIWPMFGMCNQLMACIALIVATSYILKNLKPIYGWVTFWPVLVFSSATIHGAFLKITNELLPSGTIPALVQTFIIVFFVMLIGAVLADALMKWFRIRKQSIEEMALPKA